MDLANLRENSFAGAVAGVSGVGSGVADDIRATGAPGAEVTLTVAGPEEEEEQTPPENNPATGAPSISGTVQVGETLTADVTGIADEDGLDNVSYAYQWLADDADIAGATGATHTLTSSEQGKAIKVRVSFTDDGGNDESLTSVATAAAAPPPTPLTASIHDAPESHDGENSFTFELRFSEGPDPDLSYKTLRDHAFTVAGGAVTKARRIDPPGNVRWEITVEPSSDADVTIVLPVTTDCDDQGAICTEDGRMLSADVTLTVAGPEEEEEQTPPENNPATGAPSISGTVQVGETLTADVTGIADEDGLDNVSYAYQWLADDADIAGATGATHTLTSSEQGKAIKVRVSFTDDGGNDESLTSVATAAAAPPPTPLTASIHDAPESHDGENSFTFELRFSEGPDPDFSYGALRDQALAASGGTVIKARRLDPPGNVRWEITVEPSSDADVTIVLPETTDCDDQGAICTADGRMLSAEVTLVVTGLGLDDFDAGDDQAVLASALIRMGDRGRKNNETQDRAWYASETSAWHASGQLRDGSLAWNGMTLNRVVYFSETGSFRFNEADDIHIGESFSTGGVNRELTVWIQTQTEAVSFLAKDNIRNSGSGYINFEAPTAIRSVLEGVSEGDPVIIAVSAPANS